MKIALISAGLVFAGAILVIFAAKSGYIFQDTYEVERTDVRPSNPPPLLEDDKLEDKNPAFDPDLTDPRPFGPEDNRWQLNLSAAVIALDVPDTRSDDSPALQRLYPDYAAAARELKAAGFTVLPSVNLIGGKAKQFDDGLYAALDLHMAANTEDGIADIKRLVRQLMSELNPTGDAYAWMIAALEAGRMLSPDEFNRRPAKTDEFLAAFRRSPASKPVGFYTWNEDLARVFTFLRFLQQPYHTREGVPQVLANALKRNGSCREQYSRMIEFYSKLTNPMDGLNLLALLDAGNEGKDLREIAAPDMQPTVHFLPYSDAPENALFERLYPMGVPAGAELMRDLVTAIRTGKLDLTPGDDSGWYDYQLHALEALLLPEKNPEAPKLMLTRKYKLRLLEAFKAQVTKHRETHIRQIAAANGAAAAPMPPDDDLAPRLRLEPNPTYYLRYARAYSFVQQLVLATVADPNGLNRLREGAVHRMPLGDELELMRLKFYGFYLLACEDIGLKPELRAGEITDEGYCKGLASEWLENWADDPDMAVDTRVIVPVYIGLRGETRNWCTLGVRPIHLKARYARSPSWRPWPKPGEAPAEWKQVGGITPLKVIVLGDEFAEAELRPGRVLTRAELRDIADHNPTKEAILAELQK